MRIVVVVDSSLILIAEGKGGVAPRKEDYNVEKEKIYCWKWNENMHLSNAEKEKQYE